MKGIIALKQVNTTVPTELQGRYSIVTMATKAQRSLGTHLRSHSVSAEKRPELKTPIPVLFWLTIPNI